MVDTDPDGSEAGTFAVGSDVRYDLTIRSDEDAMSLVDLYVVFALPEELEFVSGGGDGVRIAGEGQSAQSTFFVLPSGGSVSMHVVCRVLSVAPTNLVQMTASVHDADGYELGYETESTTLVEK